MRSRISGYVLLVVMVMLLFIAIGCDNDNPVDNTEDLLSNPFPANGATNVDTNIEFSWQYSNSGGNSVTYDIYLGTSLSLTILDSALTQTSYDAGQLSFDSTYHWKVIAYDTGSIQIESSIWSFSTIGSIIIPTDGITADHQASIDFDDIPSSYISDIQSNYNIYYGHTSHGSQIMTGLDMVEEEYSTHDQPYFREVSDDLGHNGDTSWVPGTRTYLDAHSECNMVMWSWCGGCSDNSEAGINTYLNAMNQLELDYPDVIFIYMTGHLNGTGADGNLYARNNQIRDYCSTNDKILFDFADIESYDPDGNYYPDESDGCAWCATWCASHNCLTCGGCAHSHCFNCYQKGKAWWWMMARIAGWDEN